MILDVHHGSLIPDTYWIWISSHLGSRRQKCIYPEYTDQMVNFLRFDVYKVYEHSCASEAIQMASSLRRSFLQLQSCHWVKFPSAPLLNAYC